MKENKLNKGKFTILIKRLLPWFAVIFAMILMVWGLAEFGSRPVQVSGPGLSEGLKSSDHIKGNTMAKVTLVEYSDFQCPACALFYPVMKKAEEKYMKDVLFVYRHFPLPSHDKAELAAKASEAAGLQGKFWEMHDKLFENQSTWSKITDAKTLFTEYAAQLGLDRNKFIADLDSDSVNKKITDDIRSGTESQLDGTPTFFINGNKLKIQTYGDIDSAISEYLTKNR